VYLSHDFQWKFRRQEPIGPYICDFVCYPKRLIVEVDGIQHAASTRDARRDAYLSSLGFQVLRFWNGEVQRELEAVLDTIAAALEARPDLHRNREPRRSQQ
jgi:very-short-patch-repair endonuclease